jgi:hypothetical protein
MVLLSTQTVIVAHVVYLTYACLQRLQLAIWINLIRIQLVHFVVRVLNFSSA